MPSFFSSSFDVATTATTMNAAPADNVEAPAKDEEEVTDETAGCNGLFRDTTFHLLGNG